MDWDWSIVSLLLSILFVCNVNVQDYGGSHDESQDPLSRKL